MTNALRRSQSQNITNTLDLWNAYQNAPPEEKMRAYWEYMESIPAARSSLAQNSGSDPVPLPTEGYPNTQSGMDEQDFMGPRNNRLLMKAMRDVPLHLSGRRSKNVEDRRGAFADFYYKNIDPLFTGARLPPDEAK